MDGTRVDATNVEDTPESVGDDASLTVRVRDGVIRGYRDQATRVFKGVPYGAPTGGDARFRAPRPPAPWDGVRDCRELGFVAPQAVDGPLPLEEGVRPGEDCLSLNVWAPDPGGGPKPVMVWIHGGAYILGYGGQRIYDGRRLSEDGDVVVVTVNYRLGALGFLDFSAIGGPGFESNVGLRDQIAALRWVRDNIAAFGGDPSSVTVFGESSGGASVTTLMTSPHAAGLFHRAIAQSPPSTSVYGPARAEQVARRFLALVGATPATIGALRELPVGVLVDAAEELFAETPATSPGTLGMAPVVDGDVVPDYPVSAFKDGLAHRIPLIIGSNRDEPSIFRFMRSPILPTDEPAIAAMFDALALDRPALPQSRLDEIAAAYPGSAAVRTMALVRDAAFRMPVTWVADAHSRFAPTYVYRYDYATPILRVARVGAGHATELPYVFGNFGSFSPDPTFWLGGRRASLALSRRMRARWTSFAHTSVPDDTGTDASARVEWLSYDDADRETMVFAATDRVEPDPDGPIRAAWGPRVLGFS